MYIRYRKFNTFQECIYIYIYILTNTILKIWRREKDGNDYNINIILTICMCWIIDLH